MRDLEIYTYLLQCWQAVVITDREKVMGGKGLMPQRKQTARSLAMQQPLWGIISCDGCVGWKTPRDPNCANAVMLWCLDDYLWEECFHFPLCLQWSGNGWKEWAGLSCSVVRTTLTGHLHLLLWCILLPLLTLSISERRALLPAMQEGCLGEEVHFFTLIAQSSGKKPSSLSFLLSTLVCICAKAGFFDVYTQSGYVVFSLSLGNFSAKCLSSPKDTDVKQGKMVIKTPCWGRRKPSETAETEEIGGFGCLHSLWSWNSHWWLASYHNSNSHQNLGT